MNKALRHWHAAYTTAAMAVGTGTAALIGATTYVPSAIQITIANCKFKLKAPIKFTRKED